MTGLTNGNGKTPNPIEIVEFIDHVPAWAVVACIALGIVIGAGALYVMINHVVIEDVPNA
jgi:hypothetical protein